MRAHRFNSAALSDDCTLLHSSHSGTQRRIVMTGARPDDSLSICLGIIRSVRLATGRAIRHLPDEINATVAISDDASPRRNQGYKSGCKLKKRAKIFSKSVSLLLTGTAKRHTLLIILLSFSLMKKKVTKKKSRLSENSSKNVTSLAPRSKLSRRRNIWKVFCSFEQSNVAAARTLVFARFSSNFPNAISLSIGERA
jgi:hypothetical protein